jgi:hypothetical protein
MTLIRASAGNLLSLIPMKFHQRSSSTLSRNKPKALLAFVVIALVLWLVAWEAAKLLIVSAPLARADAIVVMAGSAAFKERTQRAADL